MSDQLPTYKKYKKGLMNYGGYGGTIGMERELNVDFILGLYKKYIYDLRRMRKHQRKLYSRYKKPFFLQALEYANKKFGLSFRTKFRSVEFGLDDVEAEITYLLIREFKPKNIVEISPGAGWSTTYILSAIKDNGFGRLYSYDISDTSTKIVPMDLSTGRWFFIKGDIKTNIDKLPQEINYLFMDSNHSADFAGWYIQNIFSKLKNGTIVSVHDVFHTADPSGFCREGGVVIDWLKQRGIKYFTASPAKAKYVYDKIMLMKKENKQRKPIHYSQANPMIFFILNSGRQSAG